MGKFSAPSLPKDTSSKEREHLRTETVEEGGTMHRWLSGTCFPWAERRVEWVSLPLSSC